MLRIPPNAKCGVPTFDLQAVKFSLNFAKDQANLTACFILCECR